MDGGAAKRRGKLRSPHKRNPNPKTRHAMNRRTLPALLFLAFAVAYPRTALILLSLAWICVLAWIGWVMREDPANQGEASESNHK